MLLKPPCHDSQQSSAHIVFCRHRAVPEGSAGREEQGRRGRLCAGWRNSDLLRHVGWILEHGMSRSIGSVCTSPWNETRCLSQRLCILCWIHSPVTKISYKVGWVGGGAQGWELKAFVSKSLLHTWSPMIPEGPKAWKAGSAPTTEKKQAAACVTLAGHQRCQQG